MILAKEYWWVSIFFGWRDDSFVEELPSFQQELLRWFDWTAFRLFNQARKVQGTLEESQSS
jgi:hypothetical protein